MYQAGTLSGNPIAMAAGIATLTELARPGVWESIAAATASLEDRLRESARASRVPCVINRVGAMLTLFFTDRPVRSWADVRAADVARFGAFFRGLLSHGVYWVPSQFEAAFVSAAHGPEELDHTAEAARRAFAAI
jgi:glutamate-1-semialdehyde 2,1-aminomutase